MSDARLIDCIGCNTPFFFTEKEEDFLKECFGADYSPPKRCPACRKARKATLDLQRKARAAQVNSEVERVEVVPRRTRRRNDG